MTEEEIKQNYILIAGFMGYTEILTIKSGYWCNPNKSNWGLFKRASPENDLIRLCNPNDNKDWMGFDKDIGSKFANYHTNWNDLMEVVEKIESLNGGNRFTVSICYGVCEIHEYNNRTLPKLLMINSNIYSKINVVYETVIEFIEWYNKETNFQPTYKTLEYETKYEII